MQDRIQTDQHEGASVRRGHWQLCCHQHGLCCILHQWRLPQPRPRHWPQVWMSWSHANGVLHCLLDWILPGSNLKHLLLAAHWTSYQGQGWLNEDVICVIHSHIMTILERWKRMTTSPKTYEPVILCLPNAENSAYVPSYQIPPYIIVIKNL